MSRSGTVFSDRRPKACGYLLRHTNLGIKFRNNHVIVTGTGIKAWDDPDSIILTDRVPADRQKNINRFSEDQRYPAVVVMGGPEFH